MQLQITNLNGWDDLIRAMAAPHFLQTAEWAEVKSHLGWEAYPLIWREGDQTCAAALGLVRTLRWKGFSSGLRVMYIPRGPLFAALEIGVVRQVLGDLLIQARQLGAIFVKIDPAIQLATGFPGGEDDLARPEGLMVEAEVKQQGWAFSEEQIQYRNTVVIDLSLPDSVLLERMKPKTRYNIRLAERKGVVIRPAGLADVHTLYRLYSETSMRDGFVIRPEGYYRRVWEAFWQAGMADLLLAEVEGIPVAGLVALHFSGFSWFVYGMSGELHREKMPNYLLQWHAMRRARAAGCHTYDLWGAPDVFKEDDPLWGVYRFKEGLGGTVVRTLGAWDYPIRPQLYAAYTRVLPRLLAVMRWRGRKQTSKEARTL